MVGGRNSGLRRVWEWIPARVCVCGDDDNGVQ